MTQRTIKISPAGFARLRDQMQHAEIEGYGPDVAAWWGLLSIGLEPKLRVETVFEVDPTLDGPIWPFMDWPKGWDRHGAITPTRRQPTTNAARATVWI